jgi:hypothetical protein
VVVDLGRHAGGEDWLFNLPLLVYMLAELGSMLPKALHNTIESIARFLCIGNHIQKRVYSVMVTFISIWQAAIASWRTILVGVILACQERIIYTNRP